MRKIILAILALFTTLTGFAATPVLDKMIENADASKGLRITFVITMEGEKEVEGHYWGYGQKFHFTTPQMKAWYDGTNLWVYLDQNGEVNLSLPMKEDLAMINPLLNLSEVRKEDFSVTETKVPGKGYRVSAEPKGKTASQITRLTAEATEKYLPTLIRIKEKGSTSEIKVVVKSLEKGPYKEMKEDGFFAFNPNKLPGKPVIDLR